MNTHHRKQKKLRRDFYRALWRRNSKDASKIKNFYDDKLRRAKQDLERLRTAAAEE
jgi:hypothetical protein